MAEAPRAMVTDSNGELSCSVDETNRIRANLGLKPLDTSAPEKKGHKEGSKDAPLDYQQMRQDEEAEKKEEEMRQKIADMKKQRAVAKRVLSKKGLGDVSDDEDDDIAAWVERSRKKQKLQAEKLAKQLQEQDEFEDDGAYGARDLAGMKVQHDSSAFEAGETVILTLADSRILKREHGNADVNSDEDVLENIALSEFEKTAIAKERAKKRHKYHGLDDDEFTESGKSKVMLSKYDDFTVDGKKISEKEDRRSIRLGQDGSMDHTKDERQAAIREKLSAGASGKIMTNLLYSAKGEAEYQTAEELAQFKKSKQSKPKKLRRKVREKFTLEAQGGDGGADKSKDHGSRASKEMTAKEKEGHADNRRREEGFARAQAKAAEASKSLRPEDAMDQDDDDDHDDKNEIDWSKVGATLAQGDEEVIGDPDEDDRELSQSLARARRSVVKEKSYRPDIMALTADKIKEEDEGAGNDLVFTTVGEFCRNLKAVQANQPAPAAPSKKKKVEAHSTQVMDLDKKPGGAWKSSIVEMDGDEDKMEEDRDHKMKEDSSDEEDKVAQESVFEKEALASGSMAEALKIMREKGFQQEKLSGRQKDVNPDLKDGEHWADKEFAKKFHSKDKDYKQIEIQRLDEFGRPMTIKEAWRHLNHSFHGKAPGVKQQEKRKKQYQEEMKMKKLNAGEHSIQQMQKLHSVQEKGGQAHIVLSGSNSVAANALAAAAHTSKKDKF